MVIINMTARIGKMVVKMRTARGAASLGGGREDLGDRGDET